MSGRVKFPEAAQKQKPRKGVFVFVRAVERIEPREGLETVRFHELLQNPVYLADTEEILYTDIDL
jgi:hypothetical protein